MAQIEQREQERTGIKKLKIGYNRVFGYYIEVSNSYKELVPEDYIRKQTLSNCERFITQELKELESKVLGAQERMVQLEYQIFSDVRTRVADELYRVQRTAHAVARLDVLCSLRRQPFPTIIRARLWMRAIGWKLQTGDTPWWSGCWRMRPLFPTIRLSTARITAAPLSPAQIWPVNQPICGR